MPLRIVVIAEADADRRMVCGLVDLKVAHHAPDWFDHDNAPAQLDALREWCGLEASTNFTAWSRLKRLALTSSGKKAPGVRSLGFSRLPNHGYDGAAIRTALILMLLSKVRADVILLSRDLDGQHPEQRQASIETGAREAIESGFRVILALQNPMREAWLLNGFSPRDSTERRALAAEQNALQFDPCKAAHKLDSANESSLRSAKRVLRALIGSNAERADACWSNPDWQRLRECGAATGLGTFLESVKLTLVPLITGEQPC